MMGWPIWLQENSINPFIWCAVGGIVGYLAGLMMSAAGGETVENILVGVFGAFIGGDLLISQLNGGVINDKDFSFRSLLFAVVGAVVLVVVLKLMRRIVGPMHKPKSKSRDR